MISIVETKQCCDVMSNALYEREIGLVFVGKYREYGFEYRDGGSAYQAIGFCPWCGAKLPSSMRDRLFQELDRIGIDSMESRLPLRYENFGWWATSVGINEEVRILFDLEGIDPNGSTTEILWARPSVQGFVLDNSPFFVTGVCFLDLVEAHEISERLYRYVKTVKKSSNSLYRVLFGANESSAAYRLLGRLEGLGCMNEGSEVGQATLFAVNVPEIADANQVSGVLKEGVSTGVWEIQEHTDRLHN